MFQTENSFFLGSAGTSISSFMFLYRTEYVSQRGQPGRNWSMYGDQREWVVPNVQAVGRAVKACFRFQIISASYLIAAAVPMSSERM